MRPTRHPHRRAYRDGRTAPIRRENTYKRGTDHPITKARPQGMERGPDSPTPCAHRRTSGLLKLDAERQLCAFVRCEDCGRLLREVPEQTAQARRMIAAAAADARRN